MSEYTIVVDEGTTSTRAIVFNEEGIVISSARRPLKTLYPKPGWVEQSAEEIYVKSVEAIREAVEKCGCQPKILGVTNQRETVVAWDSKTGEALYNAIVWRDKRGQMLCEKLRARGYEDTIRYKTGLVLDPYFSASKIKWMIDNVSVIAKGLKTHRVKFGTIDSYLVWRFTENHFTEPSNASRTMLFNISSFAWDEELLEIFGVPFESLPEVNFSNYDFGTSKYGEILGIIGDQQSALLGNRCISPGQVKCTYGTGAFVLANAGKLKKPPSTGLIKTIAWSVNGEADYALEGSILSSGESINWLKRVNIIQNDDEIEPLARSVPSSEGLFFVPALDGLGAPRWNPRARGLFVGLSAFHTRAHLVRSVIDSMAFSVAEVIDAFRENGLLISKISVDGGGAQNSLLVQILADATNVLVERPHLHEMTAYGAFLMSGIGAKRWQLEDLKDLRSALDLFKPSNDVKDNYSKWLRSENFSIKWSE